MKIKDILLQNHKFLFLGVGGIGVSALCNFVKQGGGEVFGYDRDMQSEIVKKLQASGIPVTGCEEDLPECDVCIYSDAVSKGLISKVKARCYYSRGEFLGIVLSSFPTSVAISGSHGKTTAVAMLGEILISSPATVFLGGEYPHFCEFGGFGNLYSNGNAICVTEACEYRKNFLHLKPTIAVVLNVDKDHMDCYLDFSDLKGSFASFLKNAAISIINADDESLSSCSANISFGIEKEADYRAVNLKSKEGKYSFDCLERGKFATRVNLSVIGKHQIYNALAVIAVARQLFIPFSIITEKLNAFSGVGRRAESLGKLNGSDIFADYAHHPREIDSFVNSFREGFGENFSVLFQPHTYSRTKYLFQEFRAVLSDFPRVAVARTYAAREASVSEQEEWLLAESIKATKLHDDWEILEFITEETEKGRAVLVLGAGDIYGKVKKMLCNKIASEEKR